MLDVREDFRGRGIFWCAWGLLCTCACVRVWGVVEIVVLRMHGVGSSAYMSVLCICEIDFYFS